ncbi:MAG: twin-arginine translocation signal domain-containing protein [Clostridia bacterium]|nr:twin-arginine translocation signal domain-containing protein [Clostridia bacterium]
MKRLKKEQNAPLPPSDNEQGVLISRRDFLKGTAGFVLLCGVGFGARGLIGALSSEKDPIGPQLVDELSIIREASGGARVTAAGLTCFTVNETGERLLQLADGRHTLEDIIAKSGLSSQAESVADFFLTLGRAGYLTARLEVNKVAVQV